MNIEQLKNALEIAKTKSINKAAENLYLSQPNLSRSIKNLEAELGFKIFSRSQNGVEITIQGQDFLAHASNIVNELETISLIGHPTKEEQKFSISVPKAAYISKAFSSFIEKIDHNRSLSIDFKESSPIGAIENMMLHNFNLGIVRFREDFETFFNAFFEEEGFSAREICRFPYYAALSKDDPLANKDVLTKKDFKNYIEIVHGDSYLPGMKYNDVELSNKTIRMYDSMGQLALLKAIKNSFMLVFPLDSNTLEKYNLVTRPIEDYHCLYKDILVFRKNYNPSKYDKLFVDELEAQIRK